MKRRKAFDSLIETFKSALKLLVKNITFFNTNDEIKSKDKQIATKTNRQIEKINGYDEGMLINR